MQCPHCAQPIEKGNKICSHCGKPAVIPTADKPIRQLSAFCGNCHQRVEVDIDTCPHCGIQLDWDSVDASPSFEPPKIEPAEPEIAEDEKACVKCGRAISNNAAHCWRCGAAQQQQSGQTLPGQAQPEQPAEVCAECGSTVAHDALFCAKCRTLIPRESKLLLQDDAPDPLYTEHDAFGPWVYQIGNRHIVPPLFAAYANTLADALMAFKIPRHIERRKARYHKDLYDAVIGIYEDHVLILRRNGTTVKETRVDIRQVQAISNTLCLLKGELRLYTDSMVFLIVYNTVSDGVINRAVALIHALHKTPEKPIGLPLLKRDSDVIGILFSNLIAKLEREDSGAQFVAFQPMTDTISRSVAFVTNGRELVLIDRVLLPKKLQRSGTQQFAYSYVHVPLPQIKRIRDAEVPVRRRSERRFIIETVHHTFSWRIDEHNTGVKELIARLSRM